MSECQQILSFWNRPQCKKVLVELESKWGVIKVVSLGADCRKTYHLCPFPLPEFGHVHHFLRMFERHHKKNSKQCTRESYCLVFWVKFSANDILKYFSYFSQKTGFDIACKVFPMETICMKCQFLFSGKNIIN